MEYKNDNEILRGVLAGDREAVQYLYKTFGPKIVGYVINNNGSKEDGEEVFQNTLLRVFQNIKAGTYNHEGKLSQYLFTVAINVWYEELRYRKRQAKTTDIPDVVDDSEEAHFQAILKDNRLNALHNALKNLGDMCRELLQKFHIEDHSSKELATEYAVADNVMRKRLFDCREKLRKQTLAQM